MSHYLKPKLFSVMKAYSKEQFVKDVIAGTIVAIIALPLSIALALASGVSPERGLYTAIVAGFIISFFGGSRVQISGPTAAFATIVAGIVARNGMDGLIIATLMAGIMVVIMGVCKMGTIIKYIPYTITTGFTSGIAVTIVIGQLKDFFGLTYTHAPIETTEKFLEFLKTFSTINFQAFFVGIISLCVLIVWPKITDKIPPSLIAVITGIVLVNGLHLNVNTIGSLYEITNELPSFHVPHISFEAVQQLFPDALTIALLVMIESLLSCVVADGMIGSKHNSNAELVAQGLGNIGSALFGGIPATGAIARTAANVKNGGRTPIAGMVHSIVLVLILVILTPYAVLIPMPTIAAILFVVAYNMSEWKVFTNLVITSPKSDIIVLVSTFVLTVFFDLVVAIEVGILLAGLLFMKRMVEVTDVKGWRYLEDEMEEKLEDEEQIRLKNVPKNVRVYEINGPMFFGVADKLLKISIEKNIDIIILRMKSVPSLDVTALRALERMYKKCQKEEIKLIFSHVCEQPYTVMQKAGFVELVGEESFCSNIDNALAYAQNCSINV